jgi:uncharacterized membrane protein YdjX (TVP38/TMEM64 family)
MRLVPIVPYNVLNYAAGLAGVKTRDYLVATFIGTIPGIFILTYLASSIASGLVSPHSHSDCRRCWRRWRSCSDFSLVN